MVPISVVIPVFRDEAALARTIDSTDFNGCELIVASTPDDRAPLALLRARRPDVLWLETRRGRGHQMNAGADVARGDWIVFLHADTLLTPRWRDDVDLVRRLRSHGTLFRSRLPALTSARKWEQDGWIRRTARNLTILARYFAGTSPERLHHLYNNDHAHQTPGRHPQL